MPSDDDSAFDTDASSIFALTGLSCILVPWALAKLFNLLAGKPSEPAQWKALGFSPSAPVVRKAERLRVSWFRIANLLFVLGWAAECKLIGGAILAYEQQLFDPYETLGLRSGASSAQIRKSYRRLALEFHPDKNQQPDARRIFLDVVKAHAVLTDETARKNYEQYGSPDGPQYTRSGVALPSWLSDEASLVPMLLLVLLLPLAALYCVRDPRAKRVGAVGSAARDACIRAVLRLPATTDLGPYMYALRHAPPSSGRAPGVDEGALASAAKLVPIAASAFAHALTRGAERGELSPAQVEAARELRARLRLPVADAALAGGGAGAAQALRETLLHAHLRQKTDGGGEVAACLRAEREALLEARAASHCALRGALLRGALLRGALLRALHGAWCMVHGAHSGALRGALHLQASPALLDALFQAAVALRPLPFRHGVAKVMHFAQAVTQAVPYPAPFASLAQLPHFDAARAAAAAGARAEAAGAEAAVASSFLPPQAAAAAAAAKRSKGGKGGKGRPGGGDSAATEGGEADAGAAKAGMEPAAAANGAAAESGGGVAGVAELCAMPMARRAAALRAASLSEAETTEAEAFCALFPRAALRVRAFVAGESEGASVCAGDVVTVEVRLTLRRAAGGAAATLPAHAPLYPHCKPVAWVAVLCEAGGGRVLGACALTAGKPATLPTDAGGAGSKRLEVHAMCASYVGADVCEPLALEVRAERDEDEDGASDDEGGREYEHSDGSDDSDEDEGEGDELSAAELKALKKKGAPSQKKGAPSQKKGAPSQKHMQGTAPAAAAAATTAAVPAAPGMGGWRALVLCGLLAVCACVLLTLSDETARTRLVRTLLDAAYRWGWLGGVQSMPDLGELQSDLDEPGVQAD